MRFNGRCSLFFGAVVLTVFAALLRLSELGSRVFHHDEAAVGFFAYRLFSGGVYSYNPAFHGPFLYYVTAFVYGLLGDSVFSSRLLPAVFGVLMVPLVFFLRGYIGRLGVLVAGFFFAVSPSFLYYSRFFRNDVFVVFFVLAALVCALKYFEGEGLAFAGLAGIFLGLSAAAKENTYIYLGIFASYIFLLGVSGVYRRKSLSAGFVFQQHLRGCFVGFVFFVLVYALFYTNFFLNPEDFILSFRSALVHWYDMHHMERIGGPPYFYVPLLLLYEFPIVIFAVVGGFYYALRRDGFKVFLVYWSLASFVVYSYLGEKVPWLVLHILLPMTLLAASFLDELPQVLKNRSFWFKGVFCVLLVVFLLFFVFSSLQLNYYNYSDAAEPLIQAAQPPQKFQEMLQVIDEVAGAHDGLDTRIQVADVGVETQFLWYLRHYKNIQWKADPDSKLDAPLIVVHDEDLPEVDKGVKERYLRLDSAKMSWYRFKVSDITPGFLLFRQMNREADEYGLILLYDSGNGFNNSDVVS